MSNSYTTDTSSPFQHDALFESYELKISSNNGEVYLDDIDQETAHGVLDTLSRIYSEAEKLNIEMETPSADEVDQDLPERLEDMSTYSQVNAQYRFESRNNDDSRHRPMLPRDHGKTGREAPINLEDLGEDIEVEINGLRIDDPRAELL